MIRIPLSKPFFDSEEIEEISNVLTSGWVSQGPEVRKFDKGIADYIHVKHAIAVTNCTAALHLALLALGVKKGDEVLVADYTFPATGHAVMYCGAKPVFVDVDSNTYNIDPNKIVENITKKTRVIIPVHTFGQPAEMDQIMEIASEHDLFVVEDAACALGAKYRNNYTGTLGDIGCFSFHARKGITTGEGGMVTTNNNDLAEKIRYLSVFGMKSAWERQSSGIFSVPEFHDLGYNYKMSDITAAVGYTQLKKLDKIIDQKRQSAAIYDSLLEKNPCIKKPFVSKDVFHVYQSYVALFNKKIDRNVIVQKLLQDGIQTQIGTYSCHIQPVYHSRNICLNSIDIFRRAIALPLYYHLKKEEIYDIGNKIEELVSSFQ
jgi:dTDP-4-amino-4,6-dideoxygalactose transaminase